MLKIWGFLIFGGGFVLGQISNEEVIQLANNLQEEENTSRHYRLPTDNSEFKPDNESHIEDFGTFDFIIVGGGAGGSVVASRLSEVSDWKVLLLEAGSSGDNFTNVPNMYLPLELSRYNWGYNSTPQTTCCLGSVDGRCTHPRGKGLGGTTLINGLVYSRGHKIDYDKWGSSNPGWSYNDILPLFKKSENMNPIPPVEAPIDSSFHSRGGYLNVEYHRPLHPQLKKFLQANQEIGIPTVDYNANKIGVSPSQINTKHGERFDDFKAFVTPIQEQRKNLKIVSKALVTKILLNKHKTTGVVFAHNKQLYKAQVNKEVILSAGAYNTAQLLLLSGIGPKNHLESLNIPVVKNLEVGSRLKDHPCYFGLSFSSNLSSPILPFQDYVREFLNGTGPLAAPGGNDGVGFYESSYTNGTGLPDIEFMMIGANASNEFSKNAYRLTDSTYDSIWGNIDRASSFIIYVVALHSESNGTLRLKSASPYDFPVINPNLLSDPQGKDINTMYEGIQLAMKLLETPAFKSIDAKLQTKTFKECSHIKNTLSREYWICALRLMTITLYHPVSSCPMGPDEKQGAVVDAKLKVHGFHNLRVIDASVFPFTLSGHPNAAVVMVAEKGSDLIKKEHNS